MPVPTENADRKFGNDRGLFFWFEEKRWQGERCRRQKLLTHPLHILKSNLLFSFGILHAFVTTTSSGQCLA
jgi:hypothetical protein